MLVLACRSALCATTMLVRGRTTVTNAQKIKASFLIEFENVIMTSTSDMANGIVTVDDMLNASDARLLSYEEVAAQPKLEWDYKHPTVGEIYVRASMFAFKTPPCPFACVEDAGFLHKIHARRLGLSIFRCAYCCDTGTAEQHS
jgi:hypothetical protein